MKRKRAKPRARGTGCQLGRRCIATGTYRGKRVCDKHHADWLMADHVKAEERCCRYCGTGEDLQAAHIMSRRYLATRWLYDAHFQNIMCLCRTHHMMFTVNPAKWEQWCRDVDVPWDDLRVKALTGPVMQPKFVIERLRGEPV